MKKQFWAVLFIGLLFYSAAQAEQRVLRLGDDSYSAAHTAFLQENPDVALDSVVVADNSLEGMIAALITGDSFIDIYVIDVTNGLKALMRKGYALDLTEYSVLTDAVSRYEPAIQELLTLEGRLYAIPQYFAPTFWSVREDLWAEAGFEDFPQTYVEYLALQQAWEDEYQDLYPYNLTLDRPRRSNFLVDVIRSYIIENERPDAPLSFDEEGFKHTLELIAKLPPDREYTEEEIELSIERASLIDPHAQPLSVQHQKERLMLPPMVSAKSDPAVFVFMRAYIINPHSQNIDLAVKFLECAAQHMPIETRVLIDASLNDAVPSPYWAQQEAEFTAQIGFLQSRLQTAPPDEQQALQEEIALWQEMLTDPSYQFLITEEATARYRELSSSLAFGEDSLFLAFAGSQALDELTHIAMQYVGGSLPFTMAVDRMNRYAAMVFAEAR